MEGVRRLKTHARISSLTLLIFGMQDALRKVVKGVGGFDHAAWRTFHSEHGVRTCKGFIDGDLVEQFLELKPESQAKVASHMGADADVEEILRKVEEVSRCCH